VFSWALALDTYGLEASPFDRLKRGDLLGAKGSRTRLLSSAELALIWQATERLSFRGGETGSGPPTANT
jgi:hypothetical protein